MTQKKVARKALDKGKNKDKDRNILDRVKKIRGSGDQMVNTTPGRDTPTWSMCLVEGTRDSWVLEAIHPYVEFTGPH